MSKNDVFMRDRVMSRMYPDASAFLDPSGDGDGRAMSEERSIRELFHTLQADTSRLIHQEMELAKAEMRHKARVFKASAASFAIGGVLFFAAFLMGLWALNQGLTALLAQVMSIAIAVWLAPLLLTLGFAGTGWGMIKGGKEKIAHEGLTPRRTMQALAEDKRWAQAKVRQVTEGIKHG